ncbi:MAG TPA: prepilin-type N-terminal cleavage/methylation domain-containing protein [Candidatus Saccharimonadales bacterium]|nr:prepilin-type N-terminal cleavage/methylation domain-containing protein [Candidatus Saccharimonadales bacterium]
MKELNMEVGLPHRIELRAKPPTSSVAARRRAPGFTLIELIVVISIIALLAALVVGLASSASKGKVLNRVAVELKQLETVIEKYHKKYGFYPQDNRNNETQPPLYYELTGINPPPAIATQMGINGIANTESNNFFPTLRPMQLNPPRPEKSGYWSLSEQPPYTEPYFLVVPYRGPGPAGTVNTWRYRSTKPEHNTETYDLWADVVVAGKTNRISNWKD